MGIHLRIGSIAAFVAGLSVIFLVLAVIFRHKKKMGRTVSAPTKAAACLFAAFLVLALSLVLFPVHIPVNGTAPSFKTQLINIIPFATITHVFSIVIVHHFSFFQMAKTVFVQIGGNLLLLMPLGFFAPLLFARFRSMRRCLLLGLTVSASIELLQLAEMFFNIAFNRATDIDDLILNVVGVYIGFLLFRLISSTVLKRLAAEK